MNGLRTDSISGSTRVSRLRSVAGFTLVEIMITLVVATVGIFGMTTLFSDMMKIQKQATIAGTVSQMREAIITAVTSNTAAVGTSAWDISIADADPTTGNPAHFCLRDNSACPVNDEKAINLKNVDGTELFYARNPTRGFTYDGRLCNTFSTATPDLNCPFSWVILTSAQCVGDKPSCVNPIVVVHATVQYSPGPNDPLNGVFNPKKFEILLRRGDKKDRNEPVVISYTAADASGESGSCYLTWIARKFNKIQSDPAGNAALVGTDGFSLLPGSYECRVQVPGFKNGANQINFQIAGTDHFSSTVNASLQGESVTVTMQVNFNITGAAGAPSNIKVLHRCSQKPSMGPAGGDLTDQYILGVPVPAIPGGYSSTSYSLVSCVKTSG